MRKIILIIILFIIFLLIFLLIYFDYKNDGKFLSENGFAEMDEGMYVELLNYNQYNKTNNNDYKDYRTFLYYNKNFYDPYIVLSMHVPEEVEISYGVRNKGINKTKVNSITFIKHSEQGISGAYCQVDEKLNVLEDGNNDAFCNSEDYNKLIEENQEYLNYGISELNKYYDKNNFARSYRNL